MEKPDELIQKYKGEPFVSEVIMRFYNRVGMLECNALASDAYIISSTYNVDQENLIITGIPFGTSAPLFFNNINIVRGATAELTNKKGIRREMGIMWYDDKVLVTSEDKSKTVTYYLDFLNELEPGRPEEPNSRIEPSVHAPG